MVILPVLMDAINQCVMIVMVRFFVFMVNVKICVKLAAPRHPISIVSVVREIFDALNATLPQTTSVSVARQSIHALNATLPHLTSVNCVVLVSGSTKADALTVISYR